jgi:hypothetical protein
MKLNIIGGLLNTIMTALLFIVLPGLVIGTLRQMAPSLALGGAGTLGLSATGVLVLVVAFMRGALPKNSMIWALSGIGWTLFSAAYLYILLSTPAQYGMNIGSQPIVINFNISFLALAIAAIMALNSLSNLIELSEARRKVTEEQRLGVTEIAA